MAINPKDEWWTPPAILDAVRESLGGEFDLDPASCAEANRTVRAVQHFNVDDDGLGRDWWGRVWCNPPWSSPGVWADKLRVEIDAGRVTQAAFIGPFSAADWVERLWVDAGHVVMIRGTRHAHQWAGPGAEQSAIGRPWTWGVFLTVWGGRVEPLRRLGAVR